MSPLGRMALALALLAVACEAVPWTKGDVFVGIFGSTINVYGGASGVLKQTIDVSGANACNGASASDIALDQPAGKLWARCGQRVIAVDASAGQEGTPLGFVVIPLSFRQGIAIGQDQVFVAVGFQTGAGSEILGISRFDAPVLQDTYLLPFAMGFGSADAITTSPNGDLFVARATIASPEIRRFRVAGPGQLEELPFPAPTSLPVGQVADLVTSTDGQFLLLRYASFSIGNAANLKCIFSVALVDSALTTRSCGPDNLAGLAVAPGLPGFVSSASLAPSDVFAWQALGSDVASPALVLSPAVVLGTAVGGFALFGDLAATPPEPECPESQYIGPFAPSNAPPAEGLAAMDANNAGWWGPYRPADAQGALDASRPPVDWIDGCMRQVEVCQNGKANADPSPDCVCAAWRCLNPPAVEGPVQEVPCRYTRPTLRRFYCDLIRANGFICSAGPQLPEQCSAIGLPAPAAHRRSSLRRSLHQLA